MGPRCLTRETLQALLDGRLAERDRAAAAQHFSDCAACQASAEVIIAGVQAELVPARGEPAAKDEATNLQSFLQYLRQLPEPEPDLPVPAESFTSPVGPPRSKAADTVTLGTSSPGAPAPDTSNVQPDAALGTSIGPYRVVKLLGRGGFGIVYQAEQHTPLRRTVALKVIKPGMDSREISTRFEAERQALALMDHSHIARVLDAGTTPDGRPYFVMELVDGLSITTYCDQHRLTVRQRLELFVTVCQAVQHAHQKGIIHRDLKPSNVLVAERQGLPDAKVIDFGIAKALSQPLTDGTAMTVAGQMLGTPQYMSPEQVSGSGDIDTRSDVYSLGVLLYELLTGTTPFERERLNNSDLFEALRIIREEEPPRPSARLTSHGDTSDTIAQQRGTSARELVRAVRSDLDWIVLKALEKLRDRRYQSVGELAADIERVLKYEPIHARPPSTIYRLGKFLRRNVVWLRTMAAVCAALALGGGAAVWQAKRADFHSKQVKTIDDERKKADDEREKFKDVAQRESDNFLATQYAEQMGRAYDHLSGGRHEAAQSLLDQWVPKPEERDRRGVEWGLLAQKLRLPGDELMRLASPPGPNGAPVTRDVSCVRVAPDKSYLVAATDGGTVRRYSLKTEQELPPWEADLVDVRRLAFSPDGKLLALISYEAVVVVMETATGTVKLRFEPAQSSVGAPDIEFLNDATLVATGQGSMVRQWNLGDGATQRDHTFDGEKIIDIAVSQGFEGCVLLSSSNRTGREYLRYFKELGGEEHRPVELQKLRMERGMALALSPSGKHLAMGTASGHVHVADCRTGERLAELELLESIHDLTFSSDDQHLALVKKSGVVTVWRWQDLAEPRVDYRGKIAAVTTDAQGAFHVTTTPKEREMILTPEFRVNDFTRKHQSTSPRAVGMDAEGHFVVAWTSQNRVNVSHNMEVCAQRFEPDCRALGEFIVNRGNLVGNQYYERAAMNTRGDSVIVWSSEGQDSASSGSGLYAQCYTADGRPIGDTEFLVNTNRTRGDQWGSAVAINDTRDVIVVWMSSEDTVYQSEIYARRFRAGGAKESHPEEMPFAVLPDEPAHRRDNVAVGMDADGNTVIAWNELGNGEWQIRARCFPARITKTLGIDLQPVHSEQTTEQVNWGPSLAVNSRGDGVVSWINHTIDASRMDVYAQRLDTTGRLRGPPICVTDNHLRFNPTVTHLSSVAIDEEGRFLVAWDSTQGSDGDGAGVYARRYNADGTPAGDEFPVNNHTVSDQYCPAVAMGPRGDAVVAWTSLEQDGSGYGVYARQLTRDAEVLKKLQAAAVSQRAIHLVEDHRGRVTVEFADELPAVAAPGPSDAASRRARPSLIHWRAHPQQARSIVFSPDKNWVITAGIDGRIMRWNWGEPVARGFPPLQFDFSWLPRRKVLPIGYGNKMQFRDLRTGKSVGTLAWPARLNAGSFAVDSDERWLVYEAADPALVCWDLQAGIESAANLFATDQPHGHYLLGFVADSSRVVTRRGGNSVYEWWDVAQRQMTNRRDYGLTRLRAVALGRHNRLLVMVGNQELLIVDADTGIERHRHPFDGAYTMTLTISPVEDLLAIAQGTNIEFIDPHTAAKDGKTLLGDHAKLKKLAFSPDGQTLLALDESGLLKLWEVAHGLPLFTWRSPEPIRDFNLSPDGRWLALTRDDTTEILEIAPTLDKEQRSNSQ